VLHQGDPRGMKHLDCARLPPDRAHANSKRLGIALSLSRCAAVGDIAWKNTGVETGRVSLLVGGR
jgi:hypothetical protein